MLARDPSAASFSLPRYFEKYEIDESESRRAGWYRSEDRIVQGHFSLVDLAAEAPVFLSTLDGKHFGQ